MKNKRIKRVLRRLHDEPDAQPAERVTLLFIPFGVPDDYNTVILRGAIPRLTIDVKAEEVPEPKLLDAEADKPENEVENK